jgi:hypothetical protein
MTSDADRLADWRSWVDPNEKPYGWTYNLFNEFFSLFVRRDSWRGFVEVLKASREDAQSAAAALAQWVGRGYVETQAIAIRRIARRVRDDRPVSLVRLLDEISRNPQPMADLDTASVGLAAQNDADMLHESAERVSTFASQAVAHFDRLQTVSGDDLTLAEIHEAIDRIAEVWERWYLRITGSQIVMDVHLLPWWNVLRLVRRHVPLDNPDMFAGRIVFELEMTPDAAEALAEALNGSADEWGRAIGPLWAHDASRALAEDLREFMAESDANQRRRLVEGLRWNARLRSK